MVGRPQRRGRRTVGERYNAGMAARAILLILVPLACAAPAFSTQAATSNSDYLFARLTTERKELFLQEVFDFTLSVYSQGLNMGREISLSNRETPGLNFLPYRELDGGRERINGRSFDVRRFLGRAQAVAAGTHGIQPAVRAEIVIPPRGRGGRSGGQGPGQAEIRQVDLTPNLLAVVVRPLPEERRPEDFSGAVGSFDFSAAARPGAVAEGEPVTLTMTIRGRGNIESVAPPRVRGDDRFTAYEPKLLAREISEDRFRGRLVFEQVLVPRSTASTPLPAVVFSYFDPTRKTYRRLTAGPFPLQVAPSQDGGAALKAPAAASGTPQTAAGSDILPLKAVPGDWSSAGAPSWNRSPWFLPLQLLPPVTAMALFFLVRRRERRTRDVAGTRRLIAPKTARVGIGAAREALRQRDPRRFHEALWQVLSSYFSHRLNLLPGEISEHVVAERLSQEGVDPAVIARLGEIFHHTEQGRFGRPTSAGAQIAGGEELRLSALLDELDRLLQACERETP